ncbi:MAG: hypothetical protein JHC93_02800 [Parachlamydiales bacterium]|nr:hypothetical protein [Parachlamydiales bacterium]
MDRISDQLRSQIRGSFLKKYETNDDRNPIYEGYKSVMFKFDLFSAAHAMLTQAFQNKKEELEKSTDTKTGSKNPDHLSKETTSKKADVSHVPPSQIPQQDEGEEIPNQFWQAASKFVKEMEQLPLPAYQSPTSQTSEDQPATLSSVEQESQSVPSMPSQHAKAGEKMGAEAKPGAEVGAAGTKGTSGVTPKDKLPPWEHDPAAWTIWLVNWLISGKVIPAAYAQLESLADAAGLNAKELNLIAQIRHYMYEIAHNKGKFNYNSAELKAHPSLIKKMWSELRPFFEMKKDLSELVQMGKTAKPPNSSLEAVFKRMQGDFDKQFAKGGVNGDITNGVSRGYALYEAYMKNGKFSSASFSRYWAGNSGDLNLGSFMSSFNRHVDVSRVNSKGYVNSHYNFAFNNMGPSGPWDSFKADTGSAAQQLGDLDMTIQTDTRLAMMGLQTKLNAASAIIQEISKMLDAIASNIRGSG